MGVCSTAELKYTGIDQWRKAGFTGKGITVWNCEPINDTHGSKSAQMLVDIAPNIKRITGSLYKNQSGKTLNSCRVRDEQDGNKMVELEEFIAKYRPSIISCSDYGPQNDQFTELVKGLQKKYNFTVFNCAYNNGIEDDGESLSCKWPIETSIIIGALTWNNGNPKRASYSSIGKELDFAQLIMWWSGTSAATPVQAGMTSMMMERYGHMEQTEVIKLLTMLSKDLQEPGHDIYTGWGQPILPAVDKKYITMSTKSTRYFINGKLAEMDTMPVNKDGTTFAPVRYVAEALGKQVAAAFNPDKSIKVTVTDTKKVIELNTNSNIMLVDGKKVPLNFAPYIDSENRTLVPVRALTEGFGCKVDWVQDEAKVMILET